MHSGRCRSTSRVGGDALMTPDHIVVLVHNSGLHRAGIGRSSWKGLSSGRHEKAPVHCPCSRLAALHGAPRTLVLLKDSYNQSVQCR